MDKFATVLICMDGRIQRKVNDYLQTVFGAKNLDTITTAGTVRHLSEETEQTSRLLENLAVSTGLHGSTQIAIVAHHDCAGNPVADKIQRRQVSAAMARIKETNPETEVIGLFLDSNWIIEKITA